MSSQAKIVLITGANTGLGLETVKSLLKSDKPYEIFLGTRTVSKGEAAAKAVQDEVPDSNSRITVIQTDLASDESLQKAVKEIESKHGRLDVLINNGGAAYDPEIYNGNMSIREAWNISWDTNVAGTHVLTDFAAPLLLKSSDPRLMFLTSGTSSLAETERSDLPHLARINAAPDAGWPKKNGPDPIEAYRSVKAGLNMMMRQWERILLKDGVKVWAISPGFLATGLAGLGREKLLQKGALEPHIGADFIRDVVEGKRDSDVGKIIRKDMIQPF